jgi:hypothetical protein
VQAMIAGLHCACESGGNFGIRNCRKPCRRAWS